MERRFDPVSSAHHLASKTWWLVPPQFQGGWGILSTITRSYRTITHTERGLILSLLYLQRRDIMFMRDHHVSRINCLSYPLLYSSSVHVAAEDLIALLHHLPEPLRISRITRTGSVNPSIQPRHHYGELCLFGPQNHSKCHRGQPGHGLASAR